MNAVIHGLSNEEYHDLNGKYGCYISSSLLKLYKKSPAAYYYATHNATNEQTDAMRFGSLFHSAMQLFQEYGTIDAFWDSVAIFKAPVNPKTGQPYGATTKAYTEAYTKFLVDNQGKEVATLADVARIDDMVGALVRPGVGGSTALQVLKLLKWGKPEVSIFYETEDGIKLKIRPDLLTSSKIIDWKTTNSDDLSEDAINHAILSFGYHISAAMYQWVAHKVIGKWLDFYLVFVSKIPPYDCVMVSMANYGYRRLPGVDDVIRGCGALEFERLLDMHTQCVKENHWPGAEINIPCDGNYRILEIRPPRYYENKFFAQSV
ncbi:MAG: PD-(D/E)XK nuclease-like domain-containing protein [Lachnospiraceae bacterium]|nr:PD-(D/E)XK nuclease-like domain-containing protein [Lachnospiraceae bacterium]